MANNERNPQGIAIFGGSSAGPLAEGFVRYFGTGRFPEFSLDVAVAEADSGGGIGRMRAVDAEIPGFADEAKTAWFVGRDAAVRQVLDINGQRFDTGSTADDVRRRNDALLGALAKNGRVDTTWAANALELAVDLVREWRQVLPNQSYSNLAKYATWAACGRDAVASSEKFSHWLDVPASVHIWPASPVAHHLRLKNTATGAVVDTEAAIDEYPVDDPDAVLMSLYTADGQRTPPPTPGVQRGLQRSRIALIAPGSAFTSILPSLLPYGEDIAAMQEDDGVLAAVLNLCQEPTVPGMTVTKYLGVLARHGFTVDCKLRNTDQLPEGLEPLWDDTGEDAFGEVMTFTAGLMKAGIIQYGKNDLVAAKGLRRPVEHDGQRAASLVGQEIVIPGMGRQALRSMALAVIQ